MKEEVLNKFLEEMLNILKATKDFTLEQAPDVLQQVIHWEIAGNALGVAAGAILLLISYFAGRYCHSIMHKGYDHEGRQMISGMLTVFAFLAGAAVFSCYSSALTKVLVAPKLVLIEKVSAMIRGKP